MLTCIDRYRQVRDLVSSEWREKVFSSFLEIGGLLHGECEAEVSAQDIDIPFCVKLFFSARCLEAVGPCTVARVSEAAEIIINFLRYVNMHNVLPGFCQQIDEALSTSFVAKEQLQRNKQFSLAIPGTVNQSLSCLLGGYYQDLGQIGSDYSWLPAATRPLGVEAAQEHLHRYQISLPTKPARRCILMVTLKEMTSRDEKLEFLSFAPISEEVAVVQCNSLDDNFDGQIVKILLEKEIAKFCYPGMILEATFFQISDDFYFLDSVSRVLPSFYVELPWTDEE